MQRPVAVQVFLVRYPDEALWHQRICLALVRVVGSPDGDVYEEWYSDYTGVHLCSPRGGIPDALRGVPRYALQPLNPSTGFRVPGCDALAVVSAASVEVEPILSTMAAPMPPNPAENTFGPPLVGSIWVTLGMLERSDITICGAAWGLLRRNGVTLAIAARPLGARTTLSGVAGVADDDIFEHFLSMLILVGPVPVPSQMPWVHCARTFYRNFPSRAENHALVASGTWSWRARPVATNSQSYHQRPVN